MSKTKDVTLSDLFHAIMNIDAKMDGMEKRLSDRIDMLDVKLSREIQTVKEHVANIDERLSEVEKVKNLFNPEVFK